jgi:DNA-binding beta-propeller fold protein YncE
MSLPSIRRVVAAAATLCALGGAAAPPPVVAAPPPDHQLLSVITGGLIGEGEQFKDACGVAVDSAGKIYVADYYQNRVVVFGKEEGSLKAQAQITEIAPRDAGNVAPINGPCDLAVDASGHLYVNDYHEDVVRFTPSQFPPQKGTTYGQKLTIDDANSTGVDVDPKTGRVYVDDRTYVAVYEPDGTPVMEGSEPLRIGAGSLEDGYGVAVSTFPGTEGTVYVGDAATETVKAYEPLADPESPQFELHGEATDSGRFYLTDTDIAVDPADGHIYVATNLEPHFEERPEAVVEEFSPAGYYRGPVPRSFANGFPSVLEDGEPTGLAFSPSNDLYVTSGNYENASVIVFGPPAPFEPELLTVSKAGAGEGTVTSIPGGIGCGPTCKGEFAKDTTVVLKAAPAPDSEVLGWSGCDEVTGGNRCTARMSSARAVSVEFGLAPAPAAATPPLAAGLAESATSPRPAAPFSGSRRDVAPRGSTITQRDHLRLALSGELAPRALPRTGTAPVAVSVGGDISTTDGSDLPRLRTLRIEINRGGRIEDRGLAVCPLSRILTATSDRALAACRPALVGSGVFHANIVLKGQAPYPSTGRLLVFNGRQEGKPVLLGHIYAKKPFATSFVITFKISHQAHGTFGTVLTASLPEALGGWGYVTGLEMKLSRRYSAGGERRSYLSAGCPAPKGLNKVPFPLMRASFGFEGGKTLSSTLTRTCTAR